MIGNRVLKESSNIVKGNTSMNQPSSFCRSNSSKEEWIALPKIDAPMERTSTNSYDAVDTDLSRSSIKSVDSSATNGAFHPRTSSFAAHKRKHSTMQGGSFSSASSFAETAGSDAESTDSEGDVDRNHHLHRAQPEKKMREVEQASVKVPVQVPVSSSLSGQLPRLFASLMPSVSSSALPSCQHSPATYSPSENYCIHKSLAEKSTAVLDGLAWRIDFSLPATHSVSPITCFENYDEEEENDEYLNHIRSRLVADSHERLVQSEFGINKEMARALSARNREKEMLRPTHFRDYFGRKYHPDFTSFERMKLIDSMLHIAKRFYFEPSIIFLAVSLVDQYLSKVKNIPRHDLLELGIAALLLCYKLDRGCRKKFPLNAILFYCNFEDAREREVFARLIHQREVAIFSAIGLDPYSTTNLWDFISEFVSVAYPNVLNISTMPCVDANVSVPAGSSAQPKATTAQVKIQSQRHLLPSYYIERLKLVLCICERALMEYDIMMGYLPSTIVLAAITLADSLCPAVMVDIGSSPSPCSIADPLICSSSDGECSATPSKKYMASGKVSFQGINKVLWYHAGFDDERSANQEIIPCVQHFQKKFSQESFDYALVYAKKLFVAAETKKEKKETSAQESVLESESSIRSSSDSEEKIVFDYLQWLEFLDDELLTASNACSGAVNPTPTRLNVSASALKDYCKYLSTLPALFEAMSIDLQLLPRSVQNVQYQCMSYAASPFGPPGSAVSCCRADEEEDFYQPNTHYNNSGYSTECSPGAWPHSPGISSSLNISSSGCHSNISAATTMSAATTLSSVYASGDSQSAKVHQGVFSPVGVNISHSSMGFFSPQKTQSHSQKWSSSGSSSFVHDGSMRSFYTDLQSPTRPFVRYMSAEMKQRRWEELISVLNQKVSEMDVEEDEPLKGVRLRYRSVYHKLVLCPPLY